MKRHIIKYYNLHNNEKLLYKQVRFQDRWPYALVTTLFTVFTTVFTVSTFVILLLIVMLFVRIMKINKTYIQTKLNIPIIHQSSSLSLMRKSSHIVTSSLLYIRIITAIILIIAIIINIMINFFIITMTMIITINNTSSYSPPSLASLTYSLYL